MDSFGSFEPTEKQEVKIKYFKDQVKYLTKIESIKQEINETEYKIVLFPFPEELEFEGGLRRMGIETGPQVFIKSFKNSPFAKINLESRNISLYSIFDVFESNTIIHDQQKYRENLKNCFENFDQNTTYIGIGGGNNILETYLEAKNFDNESNVTILKISPTLNNQGFDPNSEKIYNENSICALEKKFPKANIYHYGVLDYLVTQENYKKTKENGYEVIFHDENFEFSHFEETISKEEQNNGKIILLIDCESFSTEFFQAVSDPKVDGISKKEIFKILELLSNKIKIKLVQILQSETSKNLVEAILISNFNPTVESLRSSSFLTTAIYKFIKALTL